MYTVFSKKKNLISIILKGVEFLPPVREISFDTNFLTLPKPIFSTKNLSARHQTNNFRPKVFTCSAE